MSIIYLKPQKTPLLAAGMNASESGSFQRGMQSLLVKGGVKAPPAKVNRASLLLAMPMSLLN